MMVLFLTNKVLCSFDQIDSVSEIPKRSSRDIDIENTDSSSVVIPSSPLTCFSLEEITKLSDSTQSIPQATGDADPADLLSSVLNSDRKDNADSTDMSSDPLDTQEFTTMSKCLVRQRDTRLKHSSNQVTHYNLNYGPKLLPSTRRRQGIRKSHSHRKAKAPHVFRFGDLPPELTKIILEFCDFNSLHSLTATSHAINDFVFPAFLAAAEFPVLYDNMLPSGVLDIATPEHALALCVWKRQESFHGVRVLNIALERTAREVAILVNRSLSFFESRMPLEEPFAAMINIYISSHGGLDADASRLIYGLQGSRCKRLAVTGFTGISDFHTWILADKTPLLEPTDSGYEGLEVFHACGAFPFLPHMLPFTLHNIMNAGLLELELNMNGFSVGKWAKFLNSLRFTRLQKLQLGGSISATTALKVLGNHETLRSLSLCGIIIPFTKPRLPSKISLVLPSLEYIRAPSLYIAEILKNMKQLSGVSCIAALTDFYVPFSFGSSATFRRNSVVTLLKQVTRFPTIERVEFHFSLSGSMDFCNTNQDSGIDPEIHLWFVNTLSLHKSTGAPWSNDALNKTIVWISLFPNLSSVELWEPCCYDRSEWVAALHSKGINAVIHNF